SWEVVAFNDVITYITDFQANGSFSTIKQNVQYFDNPDYAMLLRLTDLRHGLTDSSSYKYTDKKGYDFLSKSSVHGGELVVANVGAGVGTTLEVPQIEMPTTLAPNMFMVVLSKQVEKSYFLYFCQSLKYKQYIEMVNTGTGQPKINKTEYKNCQLPLPSLQEQNQVVAKINQLMTLCDQLEQQTEASIEAHQTLVEVLLNTLTSSENSDELMQNWARISEHFDTLFTTEESIDQLKQTILQLAVMGKLVPQDPTDEPAAKLLERIAEEKAQLIKEKKIKKQKTLPPISDDEKPFELPNGWSYVRLDDLCSTVSSGSTPPKTELSETDGIPFLKVYNIQNQEIEFDERTLFVSENAHNGKLKRSILYPGDVVMNLVGPPLGKVAIMPNTYQEWNCNQNIVCFRPLEIRCNSYIYTYLKAHIFLDYISLVGSAGQDFISGTKCRSIVVPVPPLSEQERLVEKVGVLLDLCTQLKHRLVESHKVQLCLTDAIIAQAV
ncbi:restriction endonuclease subunit S, partial [Vibrio coralliilyticus]